MSSKESFWHFYQDLEQRHFYEVIPQGKPCKLYFDLEYLKQHNTSRDGHSMTESLIVLVNKKLKDELGIESYYEDVLVLESSNDKKFSIHLIFTRAVFANNELCGVFVRNLLATLKDSEENLLAVQDSDGDRSCFVDSSVYTKNRNFRLFLSSKFGKPSQLLVSTIDLLTINALEQGCDNMNQLVFNHSLVTNIESSVTVIGEVDDNGNTTKMKRRSHRGSSVASGASSSSSYKSSPFVEIDEFISSLVSPGRIRQWRLCQDTIIFDISGRYCRNIGREHRSNHVFYTCDLSRGVVRQECHDEKCRGYKSEDIHLPEWTLKWTNDMMEEWSDQMNDSDDQLLLEASHGF